MPLKMAILTVGLCRAFAKLSLVRAVFLSCWACFAPALSRLLEISRAAFQDRSTTSTLVSLL